MVNKKIEWIEIIQTVDNGTNTWKAALFTIMLDNLDPNQQYLDNVNLQSVLQTKFTNEAQAFIRKLIYPMMDGLLLMVDIVIK
jgi:hypothetical protein